MGLMQVSNRLKKHIKRYVKCYIRHLNFKKMRKSLTAIEERDSRDKKKACHISTDTNVGIDSIYHYYVTQSFELI